MASSVERFRNVLHRELPLDIPTSDLLSISERMTASYMHGLQNSTASMLPSHIYHLPSGFETGYFLATDLGGSTLRVALIHLTGHKDAVRRGSIISAEHPRPMSIVEMKTWGGLDIDHLKTLTGDAFFDWIAVRIGDVVQSKFGDANFREIQMGLSWSFPIESTSIDSGKIQSMGKGFIVAEDLLGTDLKTHFTNAFERQDLKITLSAIVNDSLCALLSHAYVAPATRVALIMGTGMNAAISLPLSILPESKLVPSHSNRPSDAQEVLTNTELSMFGKGILPTTQWDDELDAAMPRPGFQPLEYLIAGGYLGEIGRRLVVDGARKEGLFQDIPEKWYKPYKLTTEMLAIMEVWPTNNLPTSYSQIHSSLEDKPMQAEDALALIHIAKHVSTRSATYCAISMHALVKLRERGVPSLSSDSSSNVLPISFVGTVLEKYPTLQQRTQDVLDRLTGWTSEADNYSQRMLLEFSPESALFGAAVAVAAALASERTRPGLLTPLQGERVSNASTLVSSHSEEEKKSVSHSEGSTRKIPEQLLFQEAISTDEVKDPRVVPKSKLTLWSRLARFCRRLIARFVGKTPT